MENIAHCLIKHPESSIKYRIYFIPQREGEHYYLINHATAC
jgi:hypothetical protein